MDFPLLAICDDELGERWLRKHFHPNGFGCPHCAVPVKRARRVGSTARSHIRLYRCRDCQTVYSIYSGTVFAHKPLRAVQVIRLLRGVCKGEFTASLSRELPLAYDTVHHLRQQLHSHAIQLQPETPRRDRVTETDEMFQNAGEKRRKTRRSG